MGKIYTADNFVKSGGTSDQYLKADGTVSTLTSPVTGTGATNTVPKFTGTSAIGNSNITDNGTVVEISTDATINGVNIGKGGGAIATNTRVGTNALNVNTTGANNIAIGISTLIVNTTGGSNTAIGESTMFSNTTGGSNVAIGRSSISANTVGNSNSALGTFSLLNNTTGSSNIGLGFNAGRFIANGTTANTITNSSIYIGADTKALADNQANQIVIGYAATGLGSNTTVLGNSSTATTAIYGSVGIGTTSPAEKLDVNGSVNVGSGIVLLGQNKIDGSSDNLKISADYGNVSGSSSIEFLTDASEAMRITSGGNVGIGTISPSAKLEVNGASILGGALNSTWAVGVNNTGTTNANGMYVNIGASSTGVPFAVYKNFSSLFTVTNGGNLLLGTTTDYGRLSVLTSADGNGTVGYFRRNNAANNDFSALEIKGDAAANTMTLSAIGLNSTSFLFEAGGAERMRITSAGLVGIGTTSPNENLEVKGSSAGVLRLSSTSYSYNVFTSNVDGTFYIRDVNNTSNRLAITSGGNVGIGNTSPSTKLDVTGAITASGGFFNSDMRLKDLTDYDYNVSDIKPITYLWKDGRDNKKHVGYSAQEVQKVMPDAVNEGTDGFLSVNYVEVLVAQVELLNNRIAQMEKEIELLKSK